MGATKVPGDNVSYTRQFLRWWNWFWFSPQDPATLGLIRICTGIFVLYVHLVYTLDLRSLISEDAWIDTQGMKELRLESPYAPVPFGWDENVPAAKRDPDPETKKVWEHWNIDPRVSVTKGQRNFSLWYLVTDPRWISPAHAIVLVLILMFLLGLWTRITSVLTWAAVLSYINRTPSSVFGMDTMTNILLIYLMIGPSGAAYSLDRLLARWRAKRSGEPFADTAVPSVGANFAIRLIQIHFCFIYLSSGLSKLQGTTWWTGNALWLTMANPEFAPMYRQRYMDLLLFISERRWLWEIVVEGGVLYTLVLEIGFPFLVWYPPLRWVCIVGAVALHVGIALIMGLATFGMSMLTLLLSFVPPETVRGFVNSLTDGVGRLLRRPQPGGTPSPVPVAAGKSG